MKGSLDGGGWTEYCGVERSDLGPWEMSQGVNKYSDFQVLRAVLEIIPVSLKINCHNILGISASYLYRQVVGLRNFPE